MFVAAISSSTGRFRLHPNAFRADPGSPRNDPWPEVEGSERARCDALFRDGLCARARDPERRAVGAPRHRLDELGPVVDETHAVLGGDSVGKPGGDQVAVDGPAHRSPTPVRAGRAGEPAEPVAEA